MSSCIHDHSRWGAGDQMGAANFMTPQTRLNALALVRKGDVFDLSHVIEMGAPRFDPVQLPYVITASATAANGIKRRAALGATNEVGSNLERIEMTTHVGTHIDALGHFTIGDRMYNGVSAADAIGDWGLESLGIEQAPPMISRGICLDLSGLDGGAFLEAGRAITRDDLERALERAGLALQTGDIVCINTGWGRFFMADNPRYLSGEPGIDETAARWLTGQEIVAIGVDNMAVEVMPGTDHPEIMMPVHQHCLVEAGVYLLENMRLDDLVAQGITSFCFIVAPVKFRGATGSPVTPIAMV